MYYFQFMVNNIALITDKPLLQKINVTINSINYQIITSNYYNFDNTYSSTSMTLASLQGKGLWCGIDSYNGAPVYSNVVSSESSLWFVYILTGLVSMSTLCLT
jgi:hypothetical protein